VGATVAKTAKTPPKKPPKEKKAPKPRKQGAGRPSFKPTQKHFRVAEETAAQGGSHRDIALAMGISYSCFKNHKELFLAHIEQGREVHVEKNLKVIEGVLLKRCKGSTYTETTQEVKVDAITGKPVSITRKTVTKRVQPSDRAIEYWLDNRAAAKWRIPAKIDSPIEKDKQIPISMDFKPPPARKKEEPKGKATGGKHA